MANVLIRNLPAEVHRALKVRAALNDRSTDAEIREILTAAVQPLDVASRTFPFSVFGVVY